MVEIYFSTISDGGNCGYSWWKSSKEENYRLHYDFKVVVKLFDFFGEHLENRLAIPGLELQLVYFLFKRVGERQLFVE